MRWHTRPAGFTLIEMLVTVAIIAIAMSVAVPSMIGFQRNAELTSAANSLTAAINTARGEAMKRNTNAFIIPSESGKPWTDGYVVFVDVDRTGGIGRFDAAADVMVTRAAPISPNLEVVGTGTATGTAPYLMFDGSGYTRDKAAGFPSLAMTFRRLDTKGRGDEFKQTRHVMITRTGRVRTCTPRTSSDDDCNPASP